ncbi:MAG: ketoacyl-ACP synthase [Alphaproteobacteria bacterium]|nr:ketoacyl-ACP synthase [Alphaproteobacteria bacterium]
MKRAIFKGVGGYLPEKIVTNADLEKIVDTNSDWIIQRTGIEQRYFAAEDQATSDLAAAAANKALTHAGLDAADIDCIIVATTTPDLTFPATAAIVQAKIGMKVGTAAFDVQAVCSGFVYALTIANSFIVSGQHKRILVIGAEIMSRLLDWNDRTTCLLFGDGAGAVILELAEGKGDVNDRGILSTHLHSDGANTNLLYTTGGPGTNGISGKLVMLGRDVYRHAVQRLAEVVEETLLANNLEKTAIDWLVPHQANKRIIESTAEKLGLSMDKVILTVARHGNTSAASVPLALADAVENNRFKPGELLLLEAMGAGLTWGSALVRW